MKIKRYFAAAQVSMLASFVFAVSAHAVPVSYDESSGDLGNNDTLGETVTEFTLDLGVNTVSGDAFAESGDNAPRDFDDMILTIQPGQVLTSATFSWTLNTGTNAQTQFRLHDGTESTDPDLSGLTTAILGTAPNMGATGMFALTLPLGAGSYLLDQISIGLTGDVAAQFDWEWSFTVAVVPLPPAAWLFISGLVAMVGLSRRRKMVT